MTHGPETSRSSDKPAGQGFGFGFGVDVGVGFGFGFDLSASRPLGLSASAQPLARAPLAGLSPASSFVRGDTSSTAPDCKPDSMPSRPDKMRNSLTRRQAAAQGLAGFNCSPPGARDKEDSLI